MRPTELQILLDLSSTIASVRNKDELFRVILDKINPVFDCSRHAVVLTIDPNEEFFELMLSSVSDFPTEEISFLKSLRSPIGPPLRVILDSEEPIIFETEALIKKYPEEIGAQFNKKLGIKEIIACRLQVSGKTIGVFSLHAENLNHFNKQQLPLFKAVAEQLAVAVSNILSGEEAILKEQEKSRLLNISKSIANVRDKNDLFHLITRELKSFIPFDVATLSVLNEDSNSFSIFLADVVDSVRNHEGFQQARTQVYPITEGSIPYRVIRSDKPLLFDIEKELVKDPDVPYLKNAYNLGMREQLLTRLIHSGKPIGALALVSLRQNTYTEREIQTLQSLSTLFAIALNNILSNQALEEREHQKEQLLKISTHIATVREKDDLFRLITDEIKSFIPFDDMVIASVDDETQTFGVFLSNMGASTMAHESYQPAITQMYRLEKGTVPYRVYTSERPFILDVEEEYKKDESDYFRYAYEFGMKEELVGRLVHSGKVIGLLAMLSKTHRYSQADIEMLQSLSSLLSIAVNNILDHEKLLLREHQKSQLLNISTHIATVRDKKDLFRLIAVDMKAFVDFDDVEIVVIDEQEKNFSFFLSGPGNGEVTRSYPIQSDNPLFNYDVFKSGKPFINDIELTHKNHPEIEGLSYVYDLGMREEIVTRLVYSGKIIGMMSVLSKTRNRFSEKDVDTVGSLSSLFAIALNNILSNQEIVIREKQKSQLLNISAHIATIKEKGDLFHLIANEVRSFIGFDDLFIASVDTDKQTFGVFLSDPGETTKDHENYTKAISYVYPLVKGTIPYKISVSEKPFIFDVETEYSKDPSDYLKFAHDFGMKDVLVTRLVNSGKVIGLLGMLSKVRRYGQADINTLQSLSSMLAIALYNILANEQIRSRDYQKSQLLKISEYIAYIRNKKDLFHLFTQELKSFLSFDDAVLFIVNEEKRTFRVVLSDPSGASRIHPEYITAVSKSFSFERGSLPDLVIRSDKPLIFDIKKEHFKHPEIEYLRHPYSFGMKDELFTRLVYSGKVIGMFAILSKETGKYSDADVETLQSLSSLIAIALNNILANEEIENLSKQLAQENLYLSEEIKSNYNFEEIVGESPALKEVFRKTMQVALADSTVLLLGETGTGKELVARAIHNLSSRKARPLIKINCAALPAQLIESELFGHEKGSFTGATDKRTGKFELAIGSTIFLDEIGELPLELQSKLLRVLQEKEIERIGGEKIIKVDVRIIAATNRNLEKEVAAGKFRQDLYYRLNIYPVELPALRERKEDIPLLAMHFIAKFSKKLGKKITGMSPEALEELKSNTWPCNVRELEHTIERSMLLCSGKTITSFNISKPVILAPNNPVVNIFQPQSLADNERDLILRTLKHTSGRVRGKDGAAELLNILPTTLEARMKKLGIRKEFVKE